VYPSIYQIKKIILIIRSFNLLDLVTVLLDLVTVLLDLVTVLLDRVTVLFDLVTVLLQDLIEQSPLCRNSYKI
jgi:hypothetical protein